MVGGLLLVAALAVYAPALDGGFVWDDDAHVTKPGLRTAAGLLRIWTDPSATQQYYPLTHSGFWLQSLFFGENPVGYHVVNVLLHAVSAWLAWLILCRLGAPAALVAAVAFLAHPLQVESVAWISELKNTLSGALYLAAGLVYLNFAPPDRAQNEPRSRPAYLVAFALFVLALLSKTVTATLPAALLLVTWWKRGRLEWKRDVGPLIPFLVLGIAMGLTTAWIEKTVIGAHGTAHANSPVERMLIAGRVWWFYLAKLLWPVGLTFIYPRWTIDARAATSYLYPAMAVAVTVTAWALRRRIGRGPATALLYFGGTLFPVLGFVDVYPFKFSFVADHFQYLASLGILALVGCAFASAPRHLGRRFGRAARSVATIVAVSWVLVLAAASWSRSHVYESAERLWVDTTARNPESFMAFNNLGYEYSRQGRDEEARRAYETAIAVKPDFDQAYFNLGRLHGKLGHRELAIESYERALALRPDYADASYNLGIELEMLGRHDEAIRAFRDAIEARPDLAEAHFNLGTCLWRSARRFEAMDAFRRALEIEPDYPEAHLNIGVAYHALGEPQRAIEEYRAAVAARPDYADAHNNLGVVYAELGDRERSAASFIEAGTLFGQRRRYADALASLRRALAQKPDSAEAYFKMGVAYARLRRNSDAVAAWDAAARLDPGGPFGATAQQSAEKLREW